MSKDVADLAKEAGVKYTGQFDPYFRYTSALGIEIDFDGDVESPVTGHFTHVEVPNQPHATEAPSSADKVFWENYCEHLDYLQFSHLEDVPPAGHYVVLCNDQGLIFVYGGTEKGCQDFFEFLQDAYTKWVDKVDAEDELAWRDRHGN